MYFAVLRKPGPAWDTALPYAKPAGMGGACLLHGRARRRRFIVLGGPVGDGTRFLFLVRASREEDIRVRLAADPWVPMEMLQVASIEPWQVLLGDPAER